MFIKVTESMFRDAFGKDSGYSYDALGTIYARELEREEETEEELELDVIAIIGEYHEYDSAIEAAEDNGIYLTYESHKDACEALNNNGWTVLKVGKGEGVVITEY